MHKSQPFLLTPDVHLDLDETSESFSSNSSFNNSYSDGCDLANWEEFIADDGTLFYAEYTSTTNLIRSNLNNWAPTITERRNNFKHRTSFRLERKPNRRPLQSSHNKRFIGQNQKQLEQNAILGDGETDDFQFSQIKLGSTINVKELDLVITSTDRFRFGRRSTAIESILGFRAKPFSDQPECLMVDGFVYDINASISNPKLTISRGDWFKSLNGIDIRTSNIDELLQQFVQPTKVCLTFQGNPYEKTSPTSSTVDGGTTQIRKIENFSVFADNYKQIVFGEDGLSSFADNNSFEFLLLPPEYYQEDKHKDCLYYYPEDVSANFLYKARGSFLTLYAVLSNELQTKPVTSRLSLEKIPYHVNFRILNGFLVLFAYATSKKHATQFSMRTNEFINYLQFVFPTLCSKNFEKSKQPSKSFKLSLEQFCYIQRDRLLASFKFEPIINFDKLLLQSRNLLLPKEAQLRIFDALSEMEAMDYRNWNDEPLATHREFFMHGCMLFFNHFLLASQLSLDVSTNVELFLRCRGIFDFITSRNVHELYIWEEIALPNSSARYFLAICTRSHLILAVILRMYDAPDVDSSAPVPPSLFYIEEIQETLDHLIQCGIESLSMIWSNSNKRPEMIERMDHNVETNESKDINKRVEAFIKQKITATGVNSISSSTITNEEETHVCSSLGGFSSPVASDGAAGIEDSDSGSDWENFTEQHPQHIDLNTDCHSQMTESLWKEIKNVVPIKISPGWKNAIFYYVYVDMANRSLFCPLKANNESLMFLYEMRKACNIIHGVLQRSKHLQKSLIYPTKALSDGQRISLVKEHGIMVDVQGIAKDRKKNSASNFRLMVVGRQFYSPPKEVYVCYHPEVPLNMVEMAFRLSFFSVG